ncbi:MAG: CoA transferase [Pseudomonadota bacterium]
MMDASTNLGRPLDGLRVIDLSAVWAMPGAGMYLADQGADVIKVEPPEGDIGRWLLAAPAIADRSRAFWMLNRNKRSVALDLKKPGALDVLHRLLQDADVVMHNFRPGVAERIGCGYEHVSSFNPGIIYVSFSAWGAKGPKAFGRGYDLLLQARSGILARRRRDGQPQPAGLFAVDMASSMLVAYAVALAIIQRGRTGRGQLIEGSLLQTALGLQKSDMVRLIGHDEPPYDSGVVEVPIFSAYRCADESYMQIVIISENEWEGLVRALELDPDEVNQKFGSIAARRDNADDLRSRLEERFGRRTGAEWETILDTHDVPAQRVFTSTDVFADPQLQANDALVKIDQPGIGQLQMLGLPFRLSHADGYEFTAAPELGQHTREVLGEFEFDPDAIDTLLRDGVAVQA